MFNRFMQHMVENIFFLAILFGLLYFLLVAVDPAPLLSSAKQYFWHVMPLSILGLLFAAVESFRHAYREKKA